MNKIMFCAVSKHIFLEIASFFFYTAGSSSLDDLVYLFDYVVYERS